MNSSSIRMARFQQRTFWFSLILSLFTKWLDWSSDENQKNGMMSKCTRSTNSPKLTWKGDIKKEPSKNHNTHFSYASFFLFYFRANNCIGQRKNQLHTWWKLNKNMINIFKNQLWFQKWHFSPGDPPILVKLHSNYFLIKFNY